MLIFLDAGTPCDYRAPPMNDVREASSAHLEIASFALRHCDHAATSPSSSMDGAQSLLKMQLCHGDRYLPRANCAEDR